MEIEAQPTLITTAGAPFNDPTDSVDLVIRTADNVDFFVLSGLLSLRSPSSFFRHALQSNRHTEERDGFPVLEVKEDSDTFRTILLLCYPHENIQIESIEKLLAVGVALEKYCMDYAIGRFEQIVIASPLIRRQALRLFVLAFRNGWRKLGEAAAKNTLFIPLNKEVAIEELSDIPALQYVILRDYHRKCSDAAEVEPDPQEMLFWMSNKDAESFKFLVPHTPNRFGEPYQNLVVVKMRGNEGDRRVNVHSWTRDYIREVSQKLRETPRPEAALDDKIISRAVFSSGEQCKIGNWKDIAVSEIQAFAQLLSKEIGRRINEVSSVESSLQLLTPAHWVPLDIKWTK